MPNGNDPAIDEYRRLAGGASAGAAVAEPEEEDPAIAEFKRMATPPKPPEDTAAMARVTKPFATIPSPQGAPTAQASRLGELPLELPPSPLQPHAVRGQFGQPIPPLPIEQQLGIREVQGAARESRAASGRNMKEQGLDAASRFALKTIQNVQGAARKHAAARSPGAPPMPEGMMDPTQLLGSTQTALHAMRPPKTRSIWKEIKKTRRSALEGAWRRTSFWHAGDLALMAGMEPSRRRSWHRLARK